MGSTPTPTRIPSRSASSRSEGATGGAYTFGWKNVRHAMKEMIFRKRIGAFALRLASAESNSCVETAECGSEVQEIGAKRPNDSEMSQNACPSSHRHTHRSD